MSSFNFLENDFTGGQVSPLMNKRSNASRYQKGVKTLQNMSIMVQGGIHSRVGFKYIAEVQDSSAVTRLIPFQFSTTETYVIELGNLYARFYKESGQILESDITITGITQANPGVVTTSGSHGLSNGDQVYITEVAGMTEVNHDKVFYTVANKTATTFELQDNDASNVDTSGYTAYSSGGVINKIYTITTPYTTAQLPDLQFTQSADQITLVHGSHEPAELTRTSDTAWTLTETTFVDGPYLAENTETTTLTPSGTTGSINITASSTTGINDGSGFISTDVGRLIRINHSGTWGNATIDSITSTTVVACTVNEDFGATTAQEAWRLGAWSDTTGFPETVTYHQQRRFYANTSTNRDTIWGSAVDDFTNFTPGTADADAVNYIIASTKVNAIYWLASSARLRIGTEGGVYSLWGGSTTSSITPTNVEADFENTYRCKKIQPVEVGNVTLFAQRSGKILRELVFDFQVDGLVAPDITLVSENILGDTGDTTDNGVIQMAFQQEPAPIVWCAKDDGELAGLTYSRETDTVGWHNHILGGTSVEVESIVSVPGTGQDRVWAIVKRTINSVTRRYVEQMGVHYRNSTNKLAKFTDSHVEYTGTKPAATLTPGATTGDGITFTAGSAVFASGDVGRIIQSGNGRAEIVTFTDTSNVVVNILRDFASTAAIAADSWTMSNTTYDKLDHLEGESVAIIADGGTHPNVTVSSGSITLDGQYTDVTVGLGYTQKVELLDIDFGSVVGTAFGSRSKVHEIAVEFFETVGGFIGYDENYLTELLFREGDDLMNEGIPLFTGIKYHRPKGGFQNSIKTLYQQTDPLPVTILGMIIKGSVSDSTG